MDRSRDGGTVDAVEEGEGGMRELEPQDHQSGDHPIGENQVVVRATTLGPQTVVTTTFTQPGILPCYPGLANSAMTLLS
ncbi:hypothetical protein [Streptomyces sp. NPDC055085]